MDISMDGAVEQMRSQVLARFPARFEARRSITVCSAPAVLEPSTHGRPMCPVAALLLRLFTEAGISPSSRATIRPRNFWDWYGDGSMPLKPATDAFRLGTNAVLHSMTH